MLLLCFPRAGVAICTTLLGFMQCWEWNPEFCVWQASTLLTELRPQPLLGGETKAFLSSFSVSLSALPGSTLPSALHVSEAEERGSSPPDVEQRW